MKSKVLRALVCLAIVLALPLTLAAFAFGLPAQYGETFLAGLERKYERLETAPGPRIVVVGGSGVAFELRSDLLEAELPGYTVVNFGLYAGLGTTVMLDLARPLLREGDIVLFSPEQSAQPLSAYFNPEAMWQAADGHPRLVGALGRDYLAPLTGQFPYFAAAKARMARDNSAPGGSGIYALSSFNSYGDIDSPLRERNVMEGGFDCNLPISFDPALLSEEFLEKVNSLADFCKSHEITFLYRFCPMNAAAISEAERGRVGEFQSTLEGSLHCPVLGDAESAILDPGWFYDSNFHLNSAGAVVSTALLAADLKALLGDTSPVTMEFPALPPLGETSGQSLPSYAGNTQIREVVVPREVTFLPDGAFDGCTALERIVMEDPDPSACSVGPGLLAGTDALIYVPPGSLSDYRTNYFWAPYASRIRENTNQPSPEPSESVEPSAPPPVTGPAIHYDGNGGTLNAWAGDTIDRAMGNAHLRVNTLQGANYFLRDGYVLTGWNTTPDGTGESAGLGSRVERQAGLTLYAQWAKASPDGEFRYEIADGGVHILAYLGNGPVCTVPENIGGLAVRTIAPGAFTGLSLDALVFPSSLRSVEEGAFTDCSIGELYLYDSLTEIHDASFSRCDGPVRLHVNATVSPVYSGSYFDTFSDKYDYLLSIQGKKKIVLFSGSSGRYGYDTPALLAAFPDYDGVNMGVYAYTNARPQLDLILPLMDEGDILLSAPEFDAAAEQFCATDRLDPSFWAMMESNYDAVSTLDMTAYSGVFDSFWEYQINRSGMVGRSYSDSPSHYDDDGNYYAFSTYNQYGDLILPRPNGERDELLRHNIADYTTGNITPEYVEALNRVYSQFQTRGVSVYFTYTPRNRNSLTPESTPQARRALHNYLAEHLSVPVISDMEDSLYSGIYFYLIDSHLTTEGASLRTAQVIKALKVASHQN